MTPQASMDPSMGQDPNAAAPADQEQPFSVTITDNGDGTYSVSSSDDDGDADDASQDSSAGSGQGGAQTAQSVEEAVEMAGKLLEQEASEDGGGAAGDPNAPLPSKDAAAAVWNQMASAKDKARSAM